MNEMTISKKLMYYIITVFTVISIALLTMSFIGRGLFESNPYNSFSIQANAWLNSRLDISENYSHLEIAIYNGKYFISFPPFPSLVLLPLVAIIGVNTPDHFIGLIFACISLILAIKIANIYLKNIIQSIQLSLLLILGSNFLHVMMWGAVWYMAQNMAFTFSLLAIYYAITDKEKHSYLSLFFLCCAAGCRPFQLVYAPLILVLLYKRKEKDVTLKAFFLKLLKWSIPAILLGCFYMWLNYARFHSIFEFGHNYLPEFLDAEHGQFSFVYVLDNLKTIFFQLPKIENESLVFPKFDGIAMWIVSPILILYVALLIAYITKKIIIKKDYKWLTTIVASFSLILIHLVLLSMHKTLGGYHFGNRYTVDVLPIVFLITVILIKDMKHREEICFIGNTLMLFGCIINVVGTILL